MRNDLAPGNPFPDLRLPEHTGRELSLSEIAGGQPLVLAFVRGWWCPKEQVRLRNLVALQDEIQREYGRLAAVTVDEPYVNGAFRAGLGATFPFLSDTGREVAEELDLRELTDELHRPFLPTTFVLDSQLSIRGVWTGFWFWGNPTPDELRLALRGIVRAEQPSFDPHRTWRELGGAAPAGAGVDAPVVWIREDSRGNELWRGAHHGEIPEVGAELGRSSVDGRPWVVRRIERDGGRTAVHVSKEGQTGDPRLVKHRLTVPPRVP
ncbi:MAG TPA: redoxin domain-containing protein [Gaiellaceae bacterium]|nr:redoxin domain-containing protein [Gaiellaceae bacterium]